MASSFEWPSAMRLATWALVLGSVRSRPIAMMWSALLAARSPPRLRRWRVVLPEDAGTGLTPQSAAKPASDRRRSALSPAVRSSCAADPWPTEGVIKLGEAGVVWQGVRAQGGGRGPT